MRIDTYSIVKLHRNKYDKDQLKDDPAPRLLVLKSYMDTAQCSVRYPNGYIQRVEYQDITEKSIFTSEHKDYPKMLLDLYAAQIEWNKNQTFRAYLEQKLPKTAIELAQIVEARNQQYAERHKQPTLSAPIMLPEVQTTDESILLLRSIDNSLKTLVQLWTGGTR